MKVLFSFGRILGRCSALALVFAASGPRETEGNPPVELCTGLVERYVRWTVGKVELINLVVREKERRMVDGRW